MAKRDEEKTSGPATWLVTGANRGIGLAFARELTLRNQRVIGTVRASGKAADLVATGARVETLDVANPSSISRLAKALSGEPLDVLIHNAGRGDGANSVRDLKADELEAFFRVNAIGPMLVTRALLPNLERGRRRIIAGITSGLASIEHSNGGWYGYRASKTALNMFIRTLAGELASKRFLCVVLSPGWVQTDMGGTGAPLSAEKSVRGMLDVLDRLTVNESGGFFDYRGKEQPW
jgi:NAD(P)-dependent dehydrogenase (short-subunit alcohol dehydrogenase family)